MHNLLNSLSKNKFLALNDANHALESYTDCLWEIWMIPNENNDKQNKESFETIKNHLARTLCIFRSHVLIKPISKLSKGYYYYKTQLFAWSEFINVTDVLNLILHLKEFCSKHLKKEKLFANETNTAHSSTWRVK